MELTGAEFGNIPERYALDMSKDFIPMFVFCESSSHGKETSLSHVPLCWIDLTLLNNAHSHIVVSDHCVNVLEQWYVYLQTQQMKLYFTLITVLILFSSMIYL